MTRRFLAATGLAAILIAAVWPAAASAQGTYPTRPIKIVLPIPPGSALDVVARAVADRMTGSLGQQVFIETRPGAGGLIAAQAVASAPADGYTLLGGASSIFTILPAQKPNLPIDVNRDFRQIGMIVGRGVMYIAVSSKLGVNSFPELVARAKAKPGQIVLGTNGAGTLPYYAGLAIAKRGIPFNIVPYNQGGTMAAVADIMGGRVHGTIEAVFGIRGPLQSGDLKLIGAMSPAREPEFPNVPAVAETLPGLTAIGFMSLAAPAGTPDAIVNRLDAALRQALETPSVKQRFEELGVLVRIMTPAQTTAFIADEQKLWLPLIKELAVQ